MRSTALLFAACVTGLLTGITGCSKEPSFPVEPAITFTSFTKILNNTGSDEKGILKISFTDGDGDLGLNQEDTLAPFNSGSIYFYNFFITMYEKQHGTYVPVSLPLTNNARIPLVPPANQGDALQGDIEIELFINNYTSPYDTIRFDAYIVDRALHASNTITTGDIIIDK